MSESLGEITAGGAFTGDFELVGGPPVHLVPQVIERDRLVMSRQPGMRHKHVPLLVDQRSGAVFSGGRYLFDSYADAEAYGRWVRETYALDGVRFAERPYFRAPEFLAWRVLHACELAPAETHAAVRLERWALTARGVDALAWELAPALEELAERHALAGAWLLVSEERREAGLVTIAARPPASPQDGLPESALRALSATSIGESIDREGWGRRMFDRAGWVWTIWLAPRPGQPGAALWPNSPPLPDP